MYSVVMICTGNLCRSPMAEGIMRRKVGLQNRSDITVSSMGVHARENQNATSDAIAVCKENMVDISGHQSRPLVFEDLRSADIIFVMEPFHTRFLQTFVPQAAEKLGLLAVWPAHSKKNISIPDPINGKLSDYRKTFTLIESHIDRLLPYLMSELPQQKSYQP